MFLKKIVFITFLLSHTNVVTKPDNLKLFVGKMILDNRTGQFIQFVLENGSVVGFTAKRHILNSDDYTPLFFLVLQQLTEYESDIMIINGTPKVTIFLNNNQVQDL